MIETWYYKNKSEIGIFIVLSFDCIYYLLTLFHEDLVLKHKNIFKLFKFSSYHAYTFTPNNSGITGTKAHYV